MSTPAVLPRPIYLRVFAISLSAVVLCLVGFLFGVRLEAVMPASGVVAAREQQDLRAALPGIIELGWHEGTVRQAKGPDLRVRVNVRGHGSTDPAQGSVQKIEHFKLADGRFVFPDELTYHKLQAGDELWPGQEFGLIRVDDLELRIRKLKARLDDLKSRGEPLMEVLAEHDALVERLDQAVIRVPDTKNCWQVLKVHAAALQAVRAGDAIALLAPIDPHTGQARDLVAFLDVHERHAGELQPGQAVRLYSTMHNQRLHGFAEGKIERLEPLGEPGPDGDRHFRARTVITQAPFPLRPGSTVKAEIVVGRKQVYRIILEQ
jgi:hypothetical protein